MGEAAWLKVRSDLYPTPPPPPPPSHPPSTTTPTSPRTSPPPPHDWDPASPCFVCRGNPYPGDNQTESSPREGTTPNPPQADSPSAAPPPAVSSCPQDPPSIIEEECTDITLDLSTHRPPTSGTPHPSSASTPRPPSTPTPVPPPNWVLTRNVGVGVGGVDLAPRLPLDLYTANLPPHLLPWLLSTHLHHLARSHQAQEDAGDEKEPLPLDLSAKSQAGRIRDAMASSGSPMPLPPMPFDRVPNNTQVPVDVKLTATRGRRRGDLSKRSYTEEELQAALRDIQSGKLGTRRAAVIYGIPRSTLRNKVYKLAMERERNKKLMEQSRGTTGLTTDIKPLSLPPCQNGVPTEARDAGGATGGEGESNTSPDSFRNLLKNKMAEKLEEMRREGLGGGASRRVVDAALSHLLHHLPRLALQHDPNTPPTPATPPLSTHPHLAEMVQKVLEERCREELQRSRARANGCSPSITVPAYAPVNGITGEQQQHPAPQPSPPLAPSTNLKEMIAQMIGQKLGCELPRDSPPTRLTLDLPRPGDKRDCKKSGSLGANGSSGGKGSRPKRGKYRNYDRDNLVKAVQAVQSGEMSVHRAGSFYGVPHSTLEYKVKERHLSRGRGKKDTPAGPTLPLQDKIKNEFVIDGRGRGDILRGPLDLPRPGDITRLQTPDTVDISTTIDLTNDDNSPESRSTPAPPLLKKPRIEGEFPGTLPSAPLLPGPFPLWRGSPLVPPLLPSYHQDLYASHMIRRFQEAAQRTSPPAVPAPGTPPAQDPPASPPHHGSVLDALLRGKAMAATGVQTTTPTSTPDIDITTTTTDTTTTLPTTTFPTTTTTIPTTTTNPTTTCTTSTSTSTSPVPCSSPPSTESSWQVSSSLLSLSKGLVVEQRGADGPSPPLLQPPGVLALNTLYLPALAARTALAAALQQRPSRSSSPEVDILPLPLVKESRQPTPVAADHP